jgi:hypothetical protein
LKVTSGPAVLGMRRASPTIGFLVANRSKFSGWT